MYLLYLTGPVMVVLVCALMMAALYGYARRGAWQTVACLVTMLAYGYMESQVIHLTSDPAVLLLDEITANLDAETEARVLEALRRASAGRTVLSVSHRVYENLGGRTIEIRTRE